LGRTLEIIFEVLGRRGYVDVGGTGRYWAALFSAIAVCPAQCGALLYASV